MKKIFFAVFILITGYLAFFIFDVPNSMARELVDEELIEALVAEDFVVLHDEEVLNLNLFHNFYIRTGRGQEDSVRVILNPYTEREQKYDIHFENGEFVLSYDIENADKRNTRNYNSMIRIFRNNQISFILENDTADTTLLSYSLN